MENTDVRIQRLRLERPKCKVFFWFSGSDLEKAVYEEIFPALVLEVVGWFRKYLT